MDARLQTRRSLAIDMRAALDEGQFVLYFQPIVDLRTSRVRAFEALLRWLHPRRGMISPVEFIPIAEETGLMAPLGAWAVRQACAEAVTWPEAVKVAVNLSPVQFRCGDVGRVVVDALAAAKLPADRLELEVTESVLVAENDATFSVLRKLRERGAKIAMDDFGTGYSSLNYLRRFPFDKIKIDKSFIADMGAGLGQRDDTLAIIRCVTTLAETLGITTTAEGVETPAQRIALCAEGCDEAQGFLFSPPRRACEVPALLARLDHGLAEAAA
jgi:EAL domain-containing protein (putative c-di-GMP-specific phosphodiesterase class I)